MQNVTREQIYFQTKSQCHKILRKDHSQYQNINPWISHRIMIWYCGCKVQARPLSAFTPPLSNCTTTQIHADPILMSMFPHSPAPLALCKQQIHYCHILLSPLYFFSQMHDNCQFLCVFFHESVIKLEKSGNSINILSIIVFFSYACDG